MISNRNYATQEAKTIPVEHISILVPKKGASYMHHSQIQFYKGKFYVTFSLGEVNEDDCRQKVMLSVSDDGQHFSEPVELFSGKELGNPDLVTAAGPIYVDEKTGDLAFTFCVYGWDPAYLVNGFRRDNNDYGKGPSCTFVKLFDGEKFTKAMKHEAEVCIIEMSATEGNADYLNIDQQAFESKNYKLPIFEKLDEGHYMVVTNTTVWTASDQYGTDAKRVSVVGLTEEEMTHGDVTLRVAEKTAEAGIPYFLCETQYWYRGNGHVRLFFRPEKYFPQHAVSRFKDSPLMQKMIPLSKEEYHYAADSYDWGRTWTLPYKTEFSGDVSLTSLGKLPDNGPYYYVGNEDASRLYHRDPLVLSLSDDGENFDRHYIIAHGGYHERFKGICKGGMFAYPHTLIHDGYMYISYTIFKEEIAIARIALADLK